MCLPGLPVLKKLSENENKLFISAVCKVYRFAKVFEYL
jgi:hypothetical protein